jgi:hypothetical protein
VRTEREKGGGGTAREKESEEREETMAAAALNVTYSDGTPAWVVAAVTVAGGSRIALKKSKGAVAASAVGHHGGTLLLVDGELSLWRLEAIVGT